jgi:hypothetical protein
MEDLKKRIGTISISKEIFDTIGFDVLSKLFSKFIPISVDDGFHDFETKHSYRGFSPDFDIVKEGESIPWYDPIINWEDRFSEPTIEFKRQS